MTYWRDDYEKIWRKEKAMKKEKGAQMAVVIKDNKGLCPAILDKEKVGNFSSFFHPNQNWIFFFTLPKIIGPLLCSLYGYLLHHIKDVGSRKKSAHKADHLLMILCQSINKLPLRCVIYEKIINDPRKRLRI